MSMSLTIKCNNLKCNNIQQHRDWFEGKEIREKIIYFDFRLNNTMSNLYHADEIVTVIKKRKRNIPSSLLCQKLHQSQLKLQQVFYQVCLREQSYLKRTVYYMDLPCVSTVCLLLIFEFRVIGMGFLNLVVSISFLTYDRYDSCFRTNTQVTTSSQ